MKDARIEADLVTLHDQAAKSWADQADALHLTALQQALGEKGTH